MGYGPWGHAGIRHDLETKKQPQVGRLINNEKKIK